MNKKASEYDKNDSYKSELEGNAYVIDSISSLDDFLSRHITGVLPCTRISSMVEYDFDEVKLSKIYSVTLETGAIVRFELEARQHTVTLNDGLARTASYNNVDHNEIDLDYCDSEYYKLGSTLFLIISHPMNWAGRMSSFSLYQLVDLRKAVLYEFVGFGNSPHVINKLDDGSLAFLCIDGKYDSSNDMWGLEIDNRSIERNDQCRIEINDTEDKTVYCTLVKIKTY